MEYYNKDRVLISIGGCLQSEREKYIFSEIGH